MNWTIGDLARTVLQESEEHDGAVVRNADTHKDQLVWSLLLRLEIRV